ncbi:MAG: hypothetical protein HQ461_05605 [Deltaproteobacteria bacterium]|nr:hypothetical protein [Deltaproteobacteria bacterium]
MQASQQLALITEVDEAVRLAASDRLLRLLIQNLPKLPERAAYRLFLAHYFLRRNRTADAIRVARHCMERGVSGGDMMLAVGALRLLETAGERVAADRVLALSELPREPIGLVQSDAESLDLTADRPRLPHDLLISVAVEMASAGAVAPEAGRGLGHVPVLTDMAPSSLRWTLENLELCTFEKGDSLFGAGAHCALWWIWGGLSDGGSTGAPAPGSFMVADGSAEGLRAASFCLALGLPSHFSDMWSFLPGVEDALAAARLRSNARVALAQALGALGQQGQEGLSLLGIAELSRDEVVVAVPGDTAVVLALEGVARVMSSDGQVLQLQAGDTAALPLGATEVRGLTERTRVALFARSAGSPD